jgi:pilus assembly protein Flp/PilA
VDPVADVHRFGDLRMFEMMQIYLLQVINRFRRDDEGAALAEYGLLVALIAVICVVAVTALGTQVSIAFSKIASAIAGA